MSIYRSDLEKDKNSRTALPFWLKRPIAHSGKQNSIKHNIHSKGLHTVCIEAKCPNRSECYSKGVATFLIMGNTCTRNCSFCGVSHGVPEKIDTNEPNHIVEAVKELNLKHVVITSVTRDDLLDGGASHFALIVKSLRSALPKVSIELLIPDFAGNIDSLDMVISSKPDVFNHNVETVPRLYPSIRPQANFVQSLKIIKRASDAGLTTKSGIMVGLGESSEEIICTMKELRTNGCSILTIGQYLQPSQNQIEVVDFISPEQFESYSKAGKEMGFCKVFAGPYVRSSYRAEELMSGLQSKQNE